MGKKNKKNPQNKKSKENARVDEETKAQEAYEQLAEQQTPQERAEEYRRNQIDCYN